MFKRKILLLFFIMFFLSLTGVLLVMLSGRDEEDAGGDVMVVTSFYPMYVLTLNVINGAEGVKTVNLIENQAGCTHDYMLSTRDMKVMSSADIFIMNGGGMDNFARKALESFPETEVIDTSNGIHMLKSHGHSSHDGPHGGDEDEEENAHIWMSISLYMEQLDTVAEELSRLVPDSKDIFNKNKEKYHNTLMELSEDVKELSERTKGMEVILFHEAFAYLASDLRMEAAYILPIDEGVSLSAGKTAEIIDLVNEHGIKLLFVEEEYIDMVQRMTADASGVITCPINPLTAGSGMMDSYIKEYAGNLKVIEEAISKMN